MLLYNSCFPHPHGGFPGGAVLKDSLANAGGAIDSGSIPGSGSFPWKMKWQPVPVFLPGESHGQRTGMLHWMWLSIHAAPPAPTHTLIHPPSSFLGNHQSTFITIDKVLMQEFLDFHVTGIMQNVFLLVWLALAAYLFWDSFVIACINGYIFISEQHVCGSTSLFIYYRMLLIQFSHSVVSDSLRPHGLQHTRLLCPSPAPGACSNSRQLSRWYHPTISSSTVPFSSCFQFFPASGSFPMNQFFASGAQSIGVSTLASVLPMNI